MKQTLKPFVLTMLALIALPALASAQDAPTVPSEGWSLHLDAQLHFPDNPDMVAHHWCRPTPLEGGIIECQIYTSDQPDAPMIGAETVVQPDAYNSFSEEEKQQWHYHVNEFADAEVNFTLPDLSGDEAQKVLDSLRETYGKIFILWSTDEQNPVGQPRVSNIDENRQ